MRTVRRADELDPLFGDVLAAAFRPEVTAEWIAGRFSVSRERAEKILREMRELGYLTSDDPAELRVSAHKAAKYRRRGEYAALGRSAEPSAERTDETDIATEAVETTAENAEEADITEETVEPSVEGTEVTNIAEEAVETTAERTKETDIAEEEIGTSVEKSEGYLPYPGNGATFGKNE